MAYFFSIVILVFTTFSITANATDPDNLETRWKSSYGNLGYQPTPQPMCDQLGQTYVNAQNPKHTFNGCIQSAENTYLASTTSPSNGITSNKFSVTREWRCGSTSAWKTTATITGCTAPNPCAGTVGDTQSVFSSGGASVCLASCTYTNTEGSAAVTSCQNANTYEFFNPHTETGNPPVTGCYAPRTGTGVECSDPPPEGPRTGNPPNPDTPPPDDGGGTGDGETDPPPDTGGGTGDGETDPPPDDGGGTGDGETDPPPDTGGGTGGTGDNPETATFCEENPESTICKNSEYAATCNQNGTINAVCEGDAIQCAMAKEQLKYFCNMQKQDTSFKNSYDELLAGTSDNPADEANRETFNLPSQLNASSNFSATCPADVSFNFQGHSINMPLSEYCPYLEAIGYLFLAMSYLLAARMLAGSI